MKRRFFTIAILLLIFFPITGIWEITAAGEELKKVSLSVEGMV